MHRDVKPENILLYRKYSIGNVQPPILTLADFECATTDLHTSKYVGSLLWPGPELPLVTPATDIWALSAIIHWLCHGRAPILPTPAGHDPEKWLENPKARYPNSLPKSYSKDLDWCMKECLLWDPEQRVTSRELVDLVAEGRRRYRRAMLEEDEESRRRREEKEMNRRREERGYDAMRWESYRGFESYQQKGFYEA